MSALLLRACVSGGRPPGSRALYSHWPACLSAACMHNVECANTLFSPAYLTFWDMKYASVLGALNLRADADVGTSSPQPPSSVQVIQNNYFPSSPIM